MNRAQLTKCLAAVSVAALAACSSTEPTELTTPFEGMTVRGNALIQPPLGDGPTPRSGSPVHLSADVYSATGEQLLNLQVDSNVSGARFASFKTGDGRSGALVFKRTKVPLVALNNIAGSVAKTMANQAILATAYDNWGCDTGILGGVTVTSEGDHGACCDNHDACYSMNGCTAGSWGHTPVCIASPSACDACDFCNLDVTACVAGPATGPSVCANMGTCGWHRNPNNPMGCVSDVSCGFARCDWATGLCVDPNNPSDPRSDGWIPQAGNAGCIMLGFYTDAGCADDDACEGTVVMTLVDGTECFQ